MNVCLLVRIIGTCQLELSSPLCCNWAIHGEPDTIWHQVQP